MAYINGNPKTKKAAKELVAQGRAKQMHAQHLVSPAGVGDGIELGLGKNKTHGPIVLRLRGLPAHR